MISRLGCTIYGWCLRAWWWRPREDAAGVFVTSRWALLPRLGGVVTSIVHRRCWLTCFVVENERDAVDAFGLVTLRVGRRVASTWTLRARVSVYPARGHRYRNAGVDFFERGGGRGVPSGVRTTGSVIVDDVEVGFNLHLPLFLCVVVWLADVGWRLVTCSRSLPTCPAVASCQDRRWRWRMYCARRR